MTFNTENDTKEQYYSVQCSFFCLMSEQEKKMKMKIKVDFFCNISHDTHNMCDRLRPCGLMDHTICPASLVES